MKAKLLTLLALLFMVVNTSCSKEDDVSEQEQEQEQEPSYTYYMYTEPYFNFGCTASEIKSKESRTLLSETSDAIIYEGENSRVSMVMYMFEDSKYNSSGVLVPYSTYNAELLVDFLSERYTVTVYDGDILFYSEENSVGGGITAQYLSGSYYYLVIYLEFESSSTKTNSSTRAVESKYLNEKERAIKLFTKSLQ